MRWLSNSCVDPVHLTGVVAIQNPGADVKGWRVSATGVVLELDADLRVVKKLKVGRGVGGRGGGG
jgi:hypothetical protein